MKVKRVLFFGGDWGEGVCLSVQAVRGDFLSGLDLKKKNFSHRSDEKLWNGGAKLYFPAQNETEK